MVHRTIVFVSSACCLLIVLSFLMFARDQVSGASKSQVSQLATTSQPAAAPAHRHPVGQPRKFIDRAAHDLTSPFQNIVPTDNNWVKRGVPALVGLIVFGAGLGYVARFTRGIA